MRKFLLLFFISFNLMLTSCDQTKNNRMIIGEWHGVEWEVAGPANHSGSEVIFTFDEKGKYTYSFNKNVEHGTYKVENDMLFVTPDQEREMMVNINTLTTDSLIFGMNRGGQAETLSLIRKK